MSFSRRIATLPWPVQFLAMLVVGGVIFGLLSFVYTGPNHPDLWPVVAIIWLVASMVVLVIAVVQRRRLEAAGRWEPRLDAIDAFQQRRAPTHPAVRFELVKIAAANRRSLGVIRWGPVLFGTLAVLAVIGAFQEPRQWVMAVLFGGTAAAYPFLYRRIRGQVETAERNVA